VADAHLAELALYGGQPVRTSYLPYGRQSVDEADIACVVETLRSDWLTTGPKVAEFEEAVAHFVGARHAVVFSSGTAALHGAVFAADLGPGDLALTSPLTFCATANCVLYQGATPQFVDVEDGQLTLDVTRLAECDDDRIKAVLPVDFAGHPARLDEIMRLADERGWVVIEDACHALGARYAGSKVGSISHMSVFSFHPVKHIATGEGGMVTTDNSQLAERLREFRSHGVERPSTRVAEEPWFYEMTSLGYNYRIADFSCALGISQLQTIDKRLHRRAEIAEYYNGAFADCKALRLPESNDLAEPAWHLYVVRLQEDLLSAGRGEIFKALRAENIGVQVHYIPVHYHPYYRDRFGLGEGLCPVAEAAYEQLISLPIWPGMTGGDVEDVVKAVGKVIGAYRI
jgi:perosamine synthetase